VILFLPALWNTGYPTRAAGRLVCYGLRSHLPFFFALLQRHAAAWHVARGLSAGVPCRLRRLELFLASWRFQPALTVWFCVPPACCARTIAAARRGRHSRACYATCWATVLTITPHSPDILRACLIPLLYCRGYHFTATPPHLLFRILYPFYLPAALPYVSRAATVVAYRRAIPQARIQRGNSTYRNIRGGDHPTRTSPRTIRAASFRRITRAACHRRRRRPPTYLPLIPTTYL